MRIASRLEMHQFLGRFPSILPLAVRVTRQNPTRGHVADPSILLVFHPPIIRPLPRYHRCMSRPFSATLRLAVRAENEKRSSCALHGFPEELEKLCQVSCDRSCLS